MFHSDDRTAHLLRESTAFKNLGDIDAALTCLAEAKERMLVSSVTYPMDTWCRAARFLVKAKRFDEAEAELNWLLADLPRRMAKEYYVDDPAAYRPRAEKLSMAKAAARYPRAFIKEQLLKVTAARVAEPKVVCSLRRETDF